MSILIFLLLIVKLLILDISESYYGTNANRTPTYSNVENDCDENPFQGKPELGITICLHSSEAIIFISEMKHFS